MKRILILITCLFIILAGKDPAYAAERIAASCSFSWDTNWPRKTRVGTCTFTANNLNAGDTYKLGVYTEDYLTPKTNNGNGPDNIDYRYPEHRLTVVGPDQGGVPENITTNSDEATITMLKSNITGVTTYDVPTTFYYTTYEADCGGTKYTEQAIVALFKVGQGIVKTKNRTITFTVANKQSMTVSAAPGVTLTSSSQVFDIGQDYDSNTLTVNVKTNNTWRLQIRINSNLSGGGGYNIPYTSNYYRVLSSPSDYINYASSKTQFAHEDTWYDTAENLSDEFTTGSSDGINLSGKDIPVIYTFKNTEIFNARTYSATTRLNLTSP